LLKTGGAEAGIAAWKRARNSKMTTRRHFRVFLSSPGDVSEERNHARKIIKD
jgi:hypothetical protein